MGDFLVEHRTKLITERTKTKDRSLKEECHRLSSLHCRNLGRREKCVLAFVMQTCVYYPVHTQAWGPFSVSA